MECHTGKTKTTTRTNNKMNQSVLQADTNDWRQARETF